VETDKAAFEIVAGVAGTVLKLIYSSGDDVPVLQPIAVIGTPGEDWQAALSGEASAPLRELNSEIAISPRARNLAEKQALPLDKMPQIGTGPGGRIIERDIIAAMQNRPPMTAAAKAAGSGTIMEKGSGLGGRLTVADLAANADLAAGAEQTLPSHSPQPLHLTEGAIAETPIKGIRKIISDRMLRSLAENAQLTLNASASAVKLQELRSKIKVQGDAKITINDLILFAVSRTLPRFPFMNAHKIGDTIKTFERVHLAIAVDTPRGLLVPVIRNANLLSLPEISSEAKRLATACQSGNINPNELSGSTFSVTNLGSLGITSFTPVLNAPEVAILGVCNIEMKPIALLPGEACECSCGVRFEPHIGFSLTFNHQVMDGAPAAKFLKELLDTVAQIDLLLAAG
jgi:pyruvate dehydrogenase E2 component (dihydrolipoamide acetyltransferase)